MRCPGCHLPQNSWRVLGFVKCATGGGLQSPGLATETAGDVERAVEGRSDFEQI
jgi:hypothetical protein